MFDQGDGEELQYVDYDRLSTLVENVVEKQKTYHQKSSK